MRPTLFTSCREGVSSRKLSFRFEVFSETQGSPGTTSQGVYVADQGYRECRSESPGGESILTRVLAQNNKRKLPVFCGAQRDVCQKASS